MMTTQTRRLLFGLDRDDAVRTLRLTTALCIDTEDRADHLAACPACRDELRALERLTEAAR